jgi:hypothetical protein
MSKIIIVDGKNIGATIVEKENGRFEWVIAVHSADGSIDYLRPSVVEDFPKREMAVTSMNHFLVSHGFRPQETASSPPVFQNPELWDHTLN